MNKRAWCNSCGKETIKKPLFRTLYDHCPRCDEPAKAAAEALKPIKFRGTLTEAITKFGYGKRLQIVESDGHPYEYYSFVTPIGPGAYPGQIKIKAEDAIMGVHEMSLYPIATDIFEEA